jgi:hypothetical protein
MADDIGYYPKASQAGDVNDDEIMTVPVTVTAAKNEVQQAPRSEKCGYMGKLKGHASSSDKRGRGEAWDSIYAAAEGLEVFCER